jgi:predicted TIM-barrel fold metal-dependent hydrolase
VGIDHVLMGSDYPQMSIAPMVEALDRLDLTKEEKAAILSGNARRIWGAGASASK